jgi:hypothetical protein
MYKPQQTLDMLRRRACSPAITEIVLSLCCDDNPDCLVKAECEKLYDKYVRGTPNPKEKRKDPTTYRNGKRYEVPQGSIDNVLLSRL